MPFVSHPAAERLRDAVCPGFTVDSLDQLGHDPFQVAALYDSRIGQPWMDLFVPVNVPRGTRPVAILDCWLPPDRLRFYLCHFTARMENESDRTRRRLADQLSGELYEFLYPKGGTDERRHVVVLGDLNEEPYGVLEEHLFAYRDRTRARKEHWTDKAVKRARLYNCSWRLLGERLPHPSLRAHAHAAGTCYWSRENEWHTYDHILVSGSLLGEDFPFLDEVGVRIVAGPPLTGADYRPCGFTFSEGGSAGVSDHLPIRGRLFLP